MCARKVNGEVVYLNVSQTIPALNGANRSRLLRHVYVKSLDVVVVNFFDAVDSGVLPQVDGEERMLYTSRPAQQKRISVPRLTLGNVHR